MDLKLEIADPKSSPTGSHYKPGSQLSINQIASQLASSKANQSIAASLLSSPVPSKSKDQKVGVDIVSPDGPVQNGKDQNSNSVVSKLTEALSLKQSPTLTKQLAKPMGGSSNKMQVITQYMCRYCGQQFDSPEVMQLHIQDHVQGKTPHQCSVCGKEYRTPSKLQRHVRVHSGERPYACSVCGRRFTRSDHVKQHMKVHFQPKDLNVCHLCNDMKFNRRQALHLHLQQQHLIQQVFSCHRCGEAYESLEEMQTHKLTHDSILNSMKDGATVSSNGVAKFALGPQKVEQVSSKPEVVKVEKAEETKNINVFKIGSNGFYVPANLDNVSTLSNKLLLEGMEKIAKEQAELEVQKKYQEELIKLNEDAKKYQEQIEKDRKRQIEEQAKIAECFTIKSGSSTPSHETEESDYKNKETTTMVAEDGMKMFILPTTMADSEADASSEGGEKRTYSEMTDDEEDSEQNSSKESAEINREGDADKSDQEEGETEQEQSKHGSSDCANKEGKISILKTGGLVRPEGYSKPCPKSKKPGYIPPAITSATASASMVAPSLITIGGNLPNQPLYTTSLLNPKINELIKAKVEQNQSPTQSTVILTDTTGGQVQPTKLAFISNGTQAITVGNLPSVFSAPSSGTTSNVESSGAGHKRAKTDMPKMLRCEHCCIWFEDNAMSLLHNTLHAADEADPFTCRKCYKKLGNRLEFMAHLVWHLEPNMDI